MRKTRHSSRERATRNHTPRREPPPDVVVFDAHHTCTLGLRISGNRGWPNVILEIDGVSHALRLQLLPDAVACMRALLDEFLSSLATQHALRDDIDGLDDAVDPTSL